MEPALKPSVAKGLNMSSNFDIYDFEYATNISFADKISKLSYKLNEDYEVYSVDIVGNFKHKLTLVHSLH